MPRPPFHVNINRHTHPPTRQFGNMNPYTGVMRITGLESNELVTILDSVNLMIDIDLHDDGFIDKNKTVTWDQLCDAC